MPACLHVCPALFSLSHVRVENELAPGVSQPVISFPSKHELLCSTHLTQIMREIYLIDSFLSFARLHTNKSYLFSRVFLSYFSFKILVGLACASASHFQARMTMRCRRPPRQPYAPISLSLSLSLTLSLSLYLF